MDFFKHNAPPDIGTLFRGTCISIEDIILPEEDKLEAPPFRTIQNVFLSTHL